MTKPNLKSALIKLEDNIHSIPFAECKLSLMYLHETLNNKLTHSRKRSAKTNEHIAHLIDELNLFINKINSYPKSSDVPKEIQEIYFKELLEQFKKLRQTLEKPPVRQFLQNAYHNILAALGLVLGLVLGCFMGPLMIGVGIYNGYKKHGLWTAVKDCHKYFLTGLAQGLILGKRITTSLENQYDRQMRFTLSFMETSLSTLPSTMGHEEIAPVEDKILRMLLGETHTVEQRDIFLNEQQEYKLISMQAAFLSQNLRGSLGHHVALVHTSTAEDGTKKHHCLELGSSSDDEIAIIERDAHSDNPDQELINQRLVRTCNGKTLLEVFVMHELLRPKYDAGFKALLKANGYRAGYNDCSTYVDLILASVGEPLSTLTRVTPKENLIGRTYCKLLEQFSVFSKQPQIGKEPKPEAKYLDYQVYSPPY